MCGLPYLSAACMFILKGNKSGRLNCITQSGVVCREGIVLTGCRCAPANVTAVHQLITVETVSDSDTMTTGEGLPGELREEVGIWEKRKLIRGTNECMG